MKKAQIHLSETVAVLFIFFVLLLFGLLFYYKYTQIAIKEEQEELLGKRAIETSLKTLFLPELICSQAEAETIDNCFDLQKLYSAQPLFEREKNYYFDLFGYAKLSVHIIYPEGFDEDIVLYENTKPDWKQREVSYFVVALRDEFTQSEDSYDFGYLQIEVYS